MMYQWLATAEGMQFKANDQPIFMIPAVSGCTDSFETIGDGAWRWIRKTVSPVTEMKMMICQQRTLTYWQVPAVNYNGNGWGSGAQYSGFSCDGEPWTYAWHRVAIPACTYAESEEFAVSLFGEEEGGMSCSIWEEDGCARQALLWPEVEGPKVLSKRFWMERYQGTMAPCDTFTALIHVTPVTRKGFGYQKLLDFAWKYFERPITMARQPEELHKMDITYFRMMWHKRPDSLVGFSFGLRWDEFECQYVRRKELQIGWVGQNASLACSLLQEYVKTGDTDARDKGLSVLDSWVKHAKLPCGLFYVDLICPPDHIDSMPNGNIPVDLDACNLGTGATYFFKAGRLCKQAGIDRPEYTKMGLDFCEFAVRAQQESGEFAKSYFLDGSINNPHGSVGAFMILPLLDAFELTKEQKYLHCALKAFAFYNGEFQKNGYTTAGALDSHCIDKESAAPLLRAAIRLHDLTGEKQYISWAVDIAYYLNTWLWHYTITFPQDTLLHEIGYDTYGGTSVSAAHNALDLYALYYVPEFLRLAELTGNPLWRQMGRVLWYNGIQCISDGSLVVGGRVRPYGTQEEAFRQTRWGRTDRKFFVPSGNLVNWMSAFREVTLDMVKDWDQLR
ncbi:MAG: hypothetical protein IJP04_07375 [Clostridia bacterium]|nr:hypothetical protein [Clostridia bacterium]